MSVRNTTTTVWMAIFVLKSALLSLLGLKQGLRGMMMSIIVIKRDGREVEFNKEKIYNAVYKAFKDTNFDENSANFATHVTDKVC